MKLRLEAIQRALEVLRQVESLTNIDRAEKIGALAADAYSARIAIEVALESNFVEIE